MTADPRPARKVVPDVAAACKEFAKQEARSKMTEVGCLGSGCRLSVYNLSRRKTDALSCESVDPLDPGILDHARPKGCVGFDQCSELRRRVAERNITDVDELLAHIGPGHDVHGFAVELLDDRCGRSRGREQAVPWGEIKARK